MYNMNENQQAPGSAFRNRFAESAHRAYIEKKNFAASTKTKYNGYQRDGKSIFAVTLSTFVSSEKIAKSDQMRKFWVREFIYRVTEQLPHALKEKVDFDCVIERSPEGHYHYHGLITMPPEAGKRIWKNGALSKELARDLTALCKKGEYRAFAVNSFLIEPIRAGHTVDQWVSYMTKTKDFIPSSDW